MHQLNYAKSNLSNKKTEYKSLLTKNLKNNKKIRRDVLHAIKKWVYWEYNANALLYFVTVIDFHKIMNVNLIINNSLKKDFNHN